MLELLFIPLGLFILSILGLILFLAILRTGQYREFCDCVDLESGQKLVCTCNGHKGADCLNR